MDDLSTIEMGRLADYLAGELSPVETVAMEQWLSANPQWQEFAGALEESRIDLSERVTNDIDELAPNIAILKQSLAAQRSKVRTADLLDSSAAEAIEGSILHPHPVVSSRPASYRNSSIPRWLRSNRNVIYALGIVAGSLCIGFFGSFLWESDNKDVSPNSVSTYSTSGGERAKVTLVDGSTVILNVASSIEVPENYGRGNRSLRLTGEALFQINSKKSDPFTVITNGAVTKVLGTTFIVRNYETDTATSVSVNEGRVAVNSSVVSAGEQLVVGSNGRHQLSSIKDPVSTFTSRILTVEPQLLLHAINDLQRWYNVEIRFGDIDIGNRRISGQFAMGSLADLKEILEGTFGIRVERSERILTLHSR